MRCKRPRPMRPVMPSSSRAWRGAGISCMTIILRLEHSYHARSVKAFMRGPPTLVCQHPASMPFVDVVRAVEQHVAATNGSIPVDVRSFVETCLLALLWSFIIYSPQALVWMEGLSGVEGDERGSTDGLWPPSAKLLSAAAASSPSVLIVLSTTAALESKEAGERMIDAVSRWFLKGVPSDL